MLRALVRAVRAPHVARNIRPVSSTRIRHQPLPFLAAPLLALLTKHATLWNVYLALNAYGWPRLYRSCIRASKDLVDTKDQEHLKKSLKEAIRFPATAITSLEESHVARFLTAYIKTNRPNIPFGGDAAMLKVAETLLLKISPALGRAATFRKNVKDKKQ